MRNLLLFFSLTILFLISNKGYSQEISEITFLVETGLKDQPSIKISKQQISISKGLLQQIEGDFNPILNFSYNRSQDVFPETKIYREGFFGDSTQSYNSNFFSYNLEVTKRFQNGLFLSPGVNLRNNGKDFSYNLLESLGEGQFITNRSNVYLRATQPLLRGRGKDFYAAQLETQQLNVSASEWDYFYDVSFQVYNILSTYLEYVGNANNLAIQTSVKDNLIKFREQLSKLAEKDIIPKSELVLINANVSSQTAAASQSSYFKSLYYNRLIESIGWHNQDGSSIPISPDTFKLPELTIYDSLTYINYWLQEAKENRGDLIASRKRLEASKRNIEFAERNNLPTLDLTATVGYNGIYESNSFDQYIAPVYSNIPGMSYSFGIIFSRPFGMDDMKGNLARTIATKEINEEILNQSELNIEQSLVSSYTEVLRYYKAAQESKKAVQFHKQALENEYTKLKLGSSTVVNLIQVQSNYAFSQSAYNNYLKFLYQAIIKFRLHSGEIGKFTDQKEIEISPNLILSLPKPLTNE
jgi:outer membrane protein TolC